MIAEYSVAAAVAVVLVIGLESLILRTGLFGQARYWMTVVIALGFQVPVDGWLTRAGAPIVSYRSQAISGVRFPWHIPVEDFAFGFALVTLTLLLWRWLALRSTEPEGSP